MRLDALIQLLGRGVKEIRRNSHSQCLVRSLLVKLLAPTIKSLLLCSQILTWRLAALRFHRPMHPLMTPVVLRTCWTRKLHLNAQPYPPDTEPAQPDSTAPSAPVRFTSPPCSPHTPRKVCPPSASMAAMCRMRVTRPVLLMPKRSSCASPAPASPQRPCVAAPI